MNKLRIAIVAAIMVVAGLGYAGTANASPVAQRGQTWAAVPEATTPCGAANPPFWCGVAPHRSWWSIGLAPFTPGEQAFAGHVASDWFVGPDGCVGSRIAGRIYWCFPVPSWMLPPQSPGGGHWLTSVKTTGLLHAAPKVIVTPKYDPYQRQPGLLIDVLNPHDKVVITGTQNGVTQTYRYYPSANSTYPSGIWDSSFMDFPTTAPVHVVVRDIYSTQMGNIVHDYNTVILDKYYTPAGS